MIAPGKVAKSSPVRTSSTKDNQLQKQKTEDLEAPALSKQLSDPTSRTATPTGSTVLSDPDNTPSDDPSATPIDPAISYLPEAAMLAAASDSSASLLYSSSASSTLSSVIMPPTPPTPVASESGAASASDVAVKPGAATKNEAEPISPSTTTSLPQSDISSDSPTSKAFSGYDTFIASPGSELLVSTPTQPSSMPDSKVSSSDSPKSSTSQEISKQEGKSETSVSSSESDFELTPISEIAPVALDTSSPQLETDATPPETKTEQPIPSLILTTPSPQPTPSPKSELTTTSLQEAQDLLVSLKVFIDNAKDVSAYQQKQAWLANAFVTLQHTSWSHAQEEVSEILYKWGRALLDFGQNEQGLERFWELYEKFPGTRWYQQVVEDLIALEKPDGMIFIPGGTVILGETNQEYHLTPYFIDTYLITNSKYYEFIKETGYPSPHYWIGDIYPVGKANHPVAGINAEDAMAYACWCQKRLPTEIEWEKAAKGPENWLWPWGNQYEINRCNCRETGLGDTSSVGNYPNGQSYYKGYDFSGNVWQWTDSWYDKNYRVLRGGSWFTTEQYTTTIYRYFDFPNSRKGIYGFRCAKSFGRSSSQSY